GRSLQCDTAPDGATFTATGLFGPRTQTSDYVYRPAPASASSLRINCTSFTGAGNVSVIITGYSEPVPGAVAIYSPAELGANAIVLPASGNTALASIIDARGAKQATLYANCSQIADFYSWPYAEDGVTTAMLVALVQGVPAATTVIVQLSSEAVISYAGGAGTITNSKYFPQRAVAFQFHNTTATPGTATAR